MNTVLARFLQTTWLVVGLAVLALLAALALLILVGGGDDTQHLVGPFRWVPSKHIA
jgi:hypothetical protein